MGVPVAAIAATRAVVGTSCGNWVASTIRCRSGSSSRTRDDTAAIVVSMVRPA
jgi:hypothetical protein